MENLETIGKELNGSVSVKWRWTLLIHLFYLFSLPALAASVPVTILHTNDLHSHFRPERTVLGLGGIARIATAVQKFRSERPNTLLVDGGDWSEGTIYYAQGTGLESLKLMNQIGYDVAVVGNHDWLNGPDILLNSIEDAHSEPKFRMEVIGANLYSAKYNRAEEFRRYIPPYAIRKVGGIYIAFIGLVTYEFIYDQFFSPIFPTEPFAITKRLAEQLKPFVDAVVVVSHNNIKINEDILKAVPEIDLIIGAHDHVALREPHEVKRSGKANGWIVETGSMGRNLGEVNLLVTPRSEAGQEADTVELKSYQLHQMDSRFPEDPVILDQVKDLESALEKQFGPVFDDHLAENHLELNREVLLESAIGDFVTDAYMSSTNADFALDQNRFIYGELHPGTIHTVDIFNTIPNVYDPIKRRCWTLKILPMKGRTLLSILNILYSYGKITQLGSISTSGMKVVFNQSLLPGSGIQPPPKSFLRPDPGQSLGFISPLSDTAFINSVLIQGTPVDLQKTYRVAVGGGIIEAFTFLNSVLPNFVPLEGLFDTGRESWRILADYVQSLVSIEDGKISIGGRIRSLQANLGVVYNDVHWEPLNTTSEGTIARIQAKVRNYGETASSPLDASNKKPASIHLLRNLNGADYGLKPHYVEIGSPQAIPSLAPGESAVFEWGNVLLPLDQGTHNLLVEITGTEDEIDHSNDHVIRWFVPPQVDWALYDRSIDLIQ